MPNAVTRFLPLAVALALPLAAGCANRSNRVSAEERAAAIKVDPDAAARLGYRLEWRGFPTMTTGSVITQFGVFGDVIVSQESTSLVTLLDARSGAYRCSDQLANPLTKFVGIVRDGNRIVCSSETDAFFLATDTCTLVDRHALGKVVTTRPALAAGLLVYGTATGEIIGHMTTTAINLWGNSVVGDITADPVSIGNTVCFVSQKGEVIILDASSSGGSSARYRIDGGVAPDDHFGGPLAISEAALYIASLDQSLYALDLRTARPLWRKRTDTPLRSHPVYFDNTLYCDLPSQGLTAFDPLTGAQRWVSPGVSGTPFVMRRGRLLVWDPRSITATAIDPGSGEVIERVKLKDVSFLKADAFADGNIYTVSPNGVIARYIPRT